MLYNVKRVAGMGWTFVRLVLKRWQALTTPNTVSLIVLLSLPRILVVLESLHETYREAAPTLLWVKAVQGIYVYPDEKGREDVLGEQGIIQGKVMIPTRGTCERSYPLSQHCTVSNLKVEKGQAEHRRAGSNDKVERLVPLRIEGNTLCGTGLARDGVDRCFDEKVGRRGKPLSRDYLDPNAVLL